MTVQLVTPRAIGRPLLLLVVACAFVGNVKSHGMALDPIARGSRWRCNPLAIPNYTDNELFCGGREWSLPSNAPGEYYIKLKLPDTLVCRHCVFRWTYVAGNNWGYCSDGTGKLGCGPQETFKTCSDIRIADATDIVPNFAYCTKAV
ncbi:uncharacterized protein LOC118460342 [Anopheles albimanus]|uniref:uncharacterized protein LOC118460342 n=1 Tax=Anopheles albimanus TaxID=7167 RepID=UPI00164211A8|nr:uncharacterized protein LOC118460342 [Anopheles albimanus]